MPDATPTPPGEDPADRHRTQPRRWIRAIADDGVSLHAFDLPTLPAAWVELLTAEPPPQPPHLISQRHVGHAQRVPDGYIVWSATDSGVLYPRCEFSRAICSVLGFNG